MNLSIFASDIETTINTTVQVESNDTGEITIPAKLLMEMLKNFADQPLTLKWIPINTALKSIPNRASLKLWPRPGRVS
jgi:DNA polymerase III subunit beta